MPSWLDSNLLYLSSLADTCTRVRNYRQLKYSFVFFTYSMLSFAFHLSFDMKTMTKSVVKRTKSANFGEPNWSNESEVMGALMGDGLLLEEAPDEYTEGPDGKPFVLAACTQNGLALKFASLDLRDDKDIALAAGKQNWRALQVCATGERARNLFPFLGLHSNAAVMLVRIFIVLLASLVRLLVHFSLVFICVLGCCCCCCCCCACVHCRSSFRRSSAKTPSWA